jgi:preprotein translocase subunit SecF
MTGLVTGDGDGRHAPRAFARMYRGQTRFDFVGRRRWWFALSGIIIAFGVVSLGVRGLNLGIDFRGGTAWIVQAPGVTQTQATDAAQSAGLSQPTVKLLGHGSSQQLEVQADLNNLSSTRQGDITKAVTRALAGVAHRPTTDVSVSHVGPTWGGEVTTRAVVALIAFFAAVVLYISWRFEPKMALAAFIAMVHDLAVALGVYSLAGFQVTPDTVVALLTILGYSLYDTVVVFDRVRENTKGVGSTGRMTYSDMINLSMNQTLARSINTSLVAILPVLAVLVIGAQVLGATTLQDYGLALFVGLLSGAYSSIFIASPVLAMLREREPRYTSIRQRLEARGERTEVLSPSAAAMATSGAGPAGSRPGRATTSRPGVLRPGAAGAGTSGTGDGRVPAAGSTRQRPAAATGAGGGLAAPGAGGAAPDAPSAGPAAPPTGPPTAPTGVPPGAPPTAPTVPPGASGRNGRPGPGRVARPPARPRKGSKPRKRR